MRRTTIVSVTKMLQLHSLSSLRDGPFGPALDHSKPQSRDYFHRWDTSKTSRFPLENCHFLFKIRSFPHEIRAWTRGRVPARKKNSKRGEEEAYCISFGKTITFRATDSRHPITFDRTGTARFYQTMAPLQWQDLQSWVLRRI